MNARSFVRGVVFLAAGCLLVGLCSVSPRPETPQDKPLTPQQKEKLKERDRFEAEMKKHLTAGKLVEAIAAAEKMLALEREVFGPVHLEVFGSWGWLAMLHEQREDFAAARKARKEALEVAIKLYGHEYWRVTDARLALADLELLAKRTPVQRQLLREAAANNQRAITLFRQGEYREALALAETSLKVRQSILGEKHHGYAISLNNLAELYRAMGAPAKAELLYRQALDILKQTLGEKNPAYAINLNNLAALYDSMGDYTKAEPFYWQALDILKQTLGEKHPAYATSLNNLAELYRTMANYAKAEPFCRQALAIRKQALGEKHPDYAISLNNLALLYRARGDYGRAEPLYQQARDVYKHALGEKHPDYASSLSNLAGFYQAMGDYTKAEPLFRQALAIRKQALGEKHPDYAISLNNLAELYRTMANYAKAEPLCRQALAIRKQAPGEKHPDYAQSLTSLALLCRAKGDYAKAEPFYRQALNIYKEVLGEKHPDYATSLNNLAGLYRAMSDYTKAEPLFRQALAIRKQALGEKHPDYATSLNNLAALYDSMGDYALAEPLYRQALSICKEVLGEKHPDYASSLNNLAGLYKTMGDYARAEPLYRQAQDIRKKALGEKHPDYASSLNNVALLYMTMGDYARAEPLYNQARGIYKEALGEKHPDYATSLNNLANLYQAMGDYAKAEPLYRQALAIREEALSEKHPDYATSLHNLASLYHAMGDYARAEPLYRQARDIRKQALREKHPTYASSLNNLASLYDSMGDYALAEPLYRQALAIRKEVLGEKHPAYATSLNNLAWLHYAMGDYARAESLYNQARGIYKEALGEKHPDYAQSLSNLTVLYLAKNEAARSLQLTRQVLHLTRAHLDLTANAQSERQQLRMNEELRGYFDFFLSAAAAAKAPSDEVYLEVFAWKGNVSLRQQQMRRLRHELIRSDPKTVRLYTDLEAATRKLAALVNTIPGPKQLDDYRRRLDDANTEAERCQQELAAASAPFRKELERARRTPAELRRSLPAGVALVDLVEYGHFTPQAKGPGTSERRLAAFVVRADRPVEWVDLGPVESLAESIELWLQGVPQRRKPVFGDDDPAVTLRERLWEPLEPHLKDIATVLISPDGVVARLPWGALPGSTPDKYLLEERAIALIAIPQFLPELLAAEKKADKRPPALLLVGDVEYGAAPGKADVEIASRGLSTVLQRGGGASWKPLPATKQEAAAIGELYRRCFPAGAAESLEECCATEGAVREAAPRCAWLHLATHGYFAPMKVNTALGRGKKRTEPSLSMAEQRGFVGFPQGLLAGVVLAGANKGGGEGEDDGILTAMEVAELDLRGCQLAVLSACETGLGEKSGGEGVLGLQRAFQVAGARGTVASLWSVPDEATRALMERFYENLWQKKMSRLEALREAQRWLLAKDAKGKRRTPPLFWAAFVLSGDWR